MDPDQQLSGIFFKDQNVSINFCRCFRFCFRCHFVILSKPEDLIFHILDRKKLFVCLFVCFEFFVLLKNLSLKMRRRRHHYKWKAANFEQCSAPMASQQWGFFSVLHLLWHRTSVYDGPLRGPRDTNLLPSVKQWSCHYLFLRLRSVRLGFEDPTFRMRGECFNRLRNHRKGLHSSSSEIYDNMNLSLNLS